MKSEESQQKYLRELQVKVLLLIFPLIAPSDLLVRKEFSRFLSSDSAIPEDVIIDYLLLESHPHQARAVDLSALMTYLSYPHLTLSLHGSFWPSFLNLQHPCIIFESVF